MNRKQFIESQGATCRNWNWSWSFVNETDKVIIFGAWDIHVDGNMTMILDKAWKYSTGGRKNAGFPQSLEHVRLIEEEGYELKTFKIIYSDEKRDANEVGPAVIKDFVPELESKSLKKVGTKWYASDGSVSNLLPEEIDSPDRYLEGASKTVSVNTYERNSEARGKCIEHYGLKCSVCSFDFEEKYGDLGEGYIHVHHIIPLSEIGGEYNLNPIEDLRPVCPNCHAIIHRTQPALSIDQLKDHIKLSL